jgi:hypothetical protein
MDVAGEVIDIPDSVELVEFPIVEGMNRKTLNFGHESKLSHINLYGRYPNDSVDRSFLRFSTRTLKILRSRWEFVA